jgi:hypothetical protein
MKQGWRATFNAGNGQRHLELPAYFRDAPRDIKLALIEWALLAQERRRRRGSAAARKKKALERMIWEFVTASLPDAMLRKKTHIDPAIFRGKTRGLVYDLQEVFDELNRQYFGETVRSYLRWGSPSALTSYQTNRRARDGSRFNLITIAGAYNGADVPRYAIDGVVYHEMLHIVYPPYKKNGRNVIHGPEFKRAERHFAHYHQWRQWERACSSKLRGTRRFRSKKVFFL